jgi:hypothetical protein
MKMMDYETPGLETKSKCSIRFQQVTITGTVRTKIITEITYGLRFRRSLYGWKDNRITFPMDLVSRLNTILFHGKR